MPHVVVLHMDYAFGREHVKRCQFEVVNRAHSQQ